MCSASLFLPITKRLWNLKLLFIFIRFKYWRCTFQAIHIMNLREPISEIHWRCLDLLSKKRTVTVFICQTSIKRYKPVINIKNCFILIVSFSSGEVDAPRKGRIEIYARDLYGRAKSLVAKKHCSHVIYVYVIRFYMYLFWYLRMCKKIDNKG